MKKRCFEEGPTIYDGYWKVDIGISIFPISNNFLRGFSKRRFFIFLLLTSYLFITFSISYFLFFSLKKKEISIYIEADIPPFLIYINNNIKEIHYRV